MIPGRLVTKSLDTVDSTAHPTPCRFKSAIPAVISNIHERLDVVNTFFSSICNNYLDIV